MTMGEQGKNGVRTYDLGECQEIVDVFFRHGHRELDTARMYAEGTTEPVRAFSCEGPSYLMLKARVFSAFG